LERRILIAIFLLSTGTFYAQELSNLQTREILVINDSIRLDTLPILPGSVFLFDTKGNRVADSLYNLLRNAGASLIAQGKPDHGQIPYT
jgi:hypothetical protein